MLKRATKNHQTSFEANNVVRHFGKDGGCTSSEVISALKIMLAYPAEGGEIINVHVVRIRRG